MGERSSIRSEESRSVTVGAKVGRLESDGRSATAATNIIDATHCVGP
jgi:hypothetical protein